MLLSLIVSAAMAATGFGLTYAMSHRLRFEERVAVGLALGLLAVTVVTFLAFELIGMGWGALSLGLLVPGAGAVAAVRGRRDEVRRDAGFARRRLRLRATAPGSLRPLAMFSVVAGAVSTRILSLSYQATADGVSVGSLAVWGDWSAHLAYAASFAYGDNRALDLPTATGTGFRYHFLADFAGSIFTVSGATLEQSMAISAWLLAVAFPALFWCVVVRLTRSRLTAGLTVLLFTLSGGVGLWYFFVDVDQRGWKILTSLPQTYARMPDQHLWVDNTISASLYAQRSTLLGLCVGAAALIVVLASRPSWSRRGFVGAGLLVGLMGIGHAHTMLTALALAFFALVADRRRDWLWFIVPTVFIGLPLAWAIRPETNSIRWLLGWMAPQSAEAWPWFWLRNVGLFLPLFVGLALLGGAMPRLRRLTTPLWLWFIVPNLISFHPSETNNTKYFLFWQLGGCLLIASWISRLVRRNAAVRGLRRQAVLAGSGVVVLLLIATGGLDTVRAMERSTAIPWVEREDVAAAAWLRRNSTPDDVIVYGASNTSAVAALGGRRAVTGYTGWTYDLGVPDWAARWDDSRTILSGGYGTWEAVVRYGVDYVVIGPIERREFAAREEFWGSNAALVFEQGEYRIYRIESIPPLGG